GLAAVALARARADDDRGRARVEAAEQRGQELEARRVEEQHAVAGRRAAALEQGPDGARPALELAVGDRGARVSVLDEDVRAPARAVTRASFEDFEQRCACLEVL